VNRNRLAKLEEALLPRPPRIHAALAWEGRVRTVLIGAGCFPAEEGLTVEDLPEGCLVFWSNPREEAASLYLDRGTNEPGIQRILGVEEDIVLGRVIAEGDGAP
jgi:hypothetical protein